MGHAIQQGHMPHEEVTGKETHQQLSPLEERRLDEERVIAVAVLRPKRDGWNFWNDHCRHPSCDQVLYCDSPRYPVLKARYPTI